VTDQNDSIERSVSSITSTWLERARQGNGEAWERLVSTYRGLVCWWAAKSGIQRQDIDDLVQEVFAAVAIAMPGYEHESFRGFLWSITRNKIQDFWRSRYRQPLGVGGKTFQEVLANVEAESSCKVGSVDAATKLVFDAVVRMVQGEFSATQWEAFWRVAVDGHTAADVAESLGISRNQVYLAKSRILRHIRTAFEDAEEIRPPPTRN
jgi:RNA polymerase sigma-70 factor, ECF subfamily